VEYKDGDGPLSSLEGCEQPVCFAIGFRCEYAVRTFSNLLQKCHKRQTFFPCVIFLTNRLQTGIFLV
jgi:hypothetical protein